MQVKEDIVPKPCDQPLKQNPFIAHRDPETGRWLILKPQEIRHEQSDAAPNGISRSTDK